LKKKVEQREHIGEYAPIKPSQAAYFNALKDDFRKRFGRDPNPDDPLVTDPFASEPVPVSEQAFAAMRTLQAASFWYKGTRTAEELYALRVVDFDMKSRRAWATDEDIDEWDEACAEWRGLPDSEKELFKNSLDDLIECAFDKDPEFLEKISDQIHAYDEESYEGYCDECGRTTEYKVCFLCENRLARPAQSPRLSGYAGESLPKKVARAHLYVNALMYWQEFNEGNYPNGWFLCLAGPDASEVPIIRNFLCIPRERVIFVDRDARCLKAAEERWPGVDTYYGDVGDLLDQLEGDIAFAHFDFMGHLNPEIEKVFRGARGKVADHGIVAYTYFRGREQSSSQNWARAQRIGQNISKRRMTRTEWKTFKKNPKNILNHARTFGYLGLMAMALSERALEEFRPLFQQEYHTGKSPMGILSLVRNPRYVYPLFQNKPVFPKGAKEELIKLFSKFESAGRELTAALFDVKPGTVSAWKAHLTRQKMRCS
jgi:hypothetical protein